MPFPENPKVLYHMNPLEHVICQLKFPPILKIDSEVPAAFQDRIRHHFPSFSDKTEWHAEVTPDQIGQVPPEIIKKVISSSGMKNYEFLSEDRRWKVNLTRSFVALSSDSYERWDGFKEKLCIPTEALVEIYSPSNFSRIGLRYINVIRRSKLNIADTNWCDLLQPYVSGVVGVPGIGDSVRDFEGKYEISLSDGDGVVRVITKMAKDEDDEICYIIDSDFFTLKKIEIDTAIEKLDYFNIRAARLLRWLITDHLHKAMEPELI